MTPEDFEGLQDKYNRRLFEEAAKPLILYKFAVVPKKVSCFKKLWHWRKIREHIRRREERFYFTLFRKAPEVNMIRWRRHGQ